MSNRQPFGILDEITAASESNNRDFDDQGRPVTSSAGARFAMQVMPATARDPGFGLRPADPDNPEDMNRLGREYRAAMEQRYGGDLAKMWAAYNAGPGRVDSAISRHGADWLANLPEETRNYVRRNLSAAGGGDVSGGNNGVRGGVGNPAQFLEGLESSLGPEARASQNVRQNADATFNSDAELGRRADAVETNLNQQGQQIDILNQVTEVAQAGAREALTRQIEQSRTISNEIVSGTQELKRKVLPIFQARGRIADQLDEVATMNPLERGIRGIFDLNYDQDYLEGQLDRFDRTLQMRAADYEYLNSLHGVALQEIERRYNMDTAMPALLQQQAEEDLGLTGMRIQQTASMLGSLRDKISTESQLIAAKAVAREDLLGRLDTPTITDLMTQAQEAGGNVAFNGVEFSYAELRDRVQAKEQQDLQVEAYRMSIASNRMDMAEKYAVNIARGLTRSQLEAAVANGGVHEGIQLPQDVLTNLYQGAVSRDETRAVDVARRMPAALALRTGADYLNQTLGLYKRSKGLFGNQAMNGSTPYITRGTDLVRRLTEATRNGEPREVITALTQEIAANSNQYQSFIDQRILTSVGGDQRAAGYLRGFVYGQELSQGTAAEAMTYFALKGNLPEGVALSPEARQVFGRAQQLVEQHRNDRPNGRAISESALQEIVTRELVPAAARIMGQARHDNLYSDLPKVAEMSQHPFGRFDATRWTEIRSEAAMTAAESIAHGLETTPQAVLQMLRTGRPVSNDEAGQQLLQRTQAAAGQYNAVEMQTTVSLLDQENQIQTGRRNSSVMLDFLGSGEFATGISSYGRALGSQSMGEYLVNPLTQGAAERNFVETRQGLVDAQSTVHQTARQMAQNPSSAMMFQPLSRTNMILKAISGVGNEGSQVLAPFVRDFYDGYMRQNFTNGIESPNSRFRREDAALFAALQQTKFEDPRMETYRKLAVRGWDDAATAQQGFITRMLEGLFGDEPSPYSTEVTQFGVTR